MKRKIVRFLSCLAVFTVAYGVLRCFCPPSEMSPQWWQTVLTLVFAVSPTLAVMYAEPTGLKGLWRDYLSFKQVRWKPGLTMLVVAAVLCPIITLLLADAGSRIGCGNLGALMTSGNYDTGLFTVDTSTQSGRLSLMLYSMVFALIVGSLSFINHLFGEIGWRGFMQRYLTVPEALKPIVIGVVWTVWMLPMYIGAGDDVLMRMALRLVENVVLSYLLALVLKRSGSVWITAAMLGVIATGNFIGAVVVTPGYVGGIVVPGLLWVVFRYPLWRKA